MQKVEGRLWGWGEEWRMFCMMSDIIAFVVTVMEQSCSDGSFVKWSRRIKAGFYVPSLFLAVVDQRSRRPALPSWPSTEQRGGVGTVLPNQRRRICISVGPDWTERRCKRSRLVCDQNQQAAGNEPRLEESLWDFKKNEKKRISAPTRDWM